MKAKLSFLLGLSLSTITSVAVAQEWQASKEALSSAYAGKTYSPYAERDFPNELLWGETHLHTKLSTDARAFGNRLDQRDAYRAARGEEIMLTWSTDFAQPVKQHFSNLPVGSRNHWG